MAFLMTVRQKKRVIDVLRKAYPGNWRYEFPSHWIGPEFEVQGYSESAARHEGEIDSRFQTVYRRTDTGEIVRELLLHGRVYNV